MIDRSYQENRSFRWVWLAALSVFVLAGLTGALYRFGIAHGMTLGFSLVNIRHAHSHLMYFGWATPVILASIALLRREAFDQSRVEKILLGVFAASFISYPFFLLLGYTPVAIGDASLPLAVIVSSLNMVAWYFFVYEYVRSMRGRSRDRSFLLFDLALLFLVLSTLGAWMLAMLKPLGIDSDVWTSALTHIFLDFFSEGWFVLGTLGILYAVSTSRPDGGHWSLWLICAGLPVTFALGMPRPLVPDALATIATVGSLLVGMGLLVNVRLLWSNAPVDLPRWLWTLVLSLLAAKAFGQVAVALTPGIWWTSLPGLRILYLHVMLLGFVSLAMALVARRFWSARGIGAFAIGVSALLLSLIPLTPILPVGLQGHWVFELAAWVALLPVFGAVWMMASTRRRRLIGA